MKKTMGIFVLAAGLAAMAQGQTTLFDSTAGSYSAGDLATQNNWAELLNTDTNGVAYPYGQSNQLGQVAFDVDNSSWVTTAGTDSDFNVTTNGSFVYLDEASAGNDVDNLWTYTMDFNISIPDGGAAGVAMPNAEFFYVGLTAATNGSLSEFDKKDLCYVLRTRAEYGRLDINFQSGDISTQRAIQLKPEDIGWAPEAKNNAGDDVTADYQSDNLRLTMNIRKTHTADTYEAFATLENLATGVEFSGLIGSSNRVVYSSFSTEAYATNDLFVGMGRTPQAATTVGLLDIDIDALDVELSTLPPALSAPATVTAIPYDNQVTLVWDAVIEADSYDVLRSTSMGGPYSALTNVLETSLQDNAVMNNTEYYYVIQTKFGAAGNSTNSMEVSGMPQAISTGSLVDTSFTAPDYSNGDLAGQQQWIKVAGSSNNAFNVINASTTGEADTVSTTASFSTNVGNAVYFDEITDNMVNDAWEGYVDFVVSAEQSAGSDIALINNQDVLAFGITSDKAAPLFLTGNENDQMALMTVLVRANGKLVAMFATEANDGDTTRLATLLGAAETGWDPQNAAALDLESDLIRFTWKIRKSTADGTYQAFGSLSNLTTGVAHANTQATVPFVSTSKQAMYDSPSANFVMGHYYKSKLNASSELVNVAVGAVSVTHSADNLPAIIPPTGISAIGGDRSVALSWGDVFEATDYDVLFAEAAGGDQIVVGSNLTSISFFDSPRFNGITNYYTVRANFVGESADSVEVPGLPFGSVKQIDWDGEKAAGNNVASGQFIVDQTTGLQTNGSVCYIEYSATPVLSTALYSKYENIPLYGLTQRNSLATTLTDKNAAAYEVQIKNSNGIEADSFDLWAANGSLQQLAYFKSEDWEDAPSSVDLTTEAHSVTWANKLMSGGNQRLAIRNGSDWYVSETTTANGTGDPLGAGLRTIANLADENWAPLTVTPGVWMANPTTYNTANNASFTDVNAMGWFWSGGNGSRMKTFKFIYNASGSSPAFEYWAESNGLTNGIDSATDDPDADGYDNQSEYGLGGDPLDPESQGVLPQILVGDLNGTEGIVYVHNERRDPTSGITYTPVTTGNLVAPDWQPADLEPGVSESIVDLDYYWKEISTFIPTTDPQKFIGLLIDED